MKAKRRNYEIISREEAIEEEIELDAIDYEIANLIVENCKITNLKISKTIGISNDAVGFRRKSYPLKGYINSLMHLRNTKAIDILLNVQSETIDRLIKLSQFADSETNRLKATIELSKLTIQSNIKNNVEVEVKPVEVTISNEFLPDDESEQTVE